jgi:DNA-directed RNA polymerase specialized sigma24 family protein
MYGTNLSFKELNLNYQSQQNFLIELRRRFYSFVVKFIKNETEVEDVLLEGIYIIYKHQESLNSKPVSEIMLIYKTIIQNKCIDILRKRKSAKKYYNHFANNNSIEGDINLFRLNNKQFDEYINHFIKTINTYLNIGNSEKKIFIAYLKNLDLNREELAQKLGLNKRSIINALSLVRSAIRNHPLVFELLNNYKLKQ